MGLNSAFKVSKWILMKYVIENPISKLMILSFLTRDAGQRPRLQRDQVGYTNVTFLRKGTVVVMLQNEKPNGQYFSPNIVRVIRSRRMCWAGHVACMGDGRVVYRVSAGTPEGKRPFGKPRLR
jgi:hypothetical protein